MKKIFSIILVVMLVMSCMVTATLADTEKTSGDPLKIVKTYDFSDMTDFQNVNAKDNQKEGCTFTNETYSYGKGYNQVKQLKIVNTGTNSPNIGFNPKSSGRAVLKDCIDSDVIALSMDVQATLGTGTFYTMFTYKKPNDSEGYKTLFQFDSAGNLKIASDGKAAADSDISMDYVSGQWYNISIIANRKSEKIYLSVDGEVKSTIDVNSESNWLEFDFSNSLDYFYLDTRLRTLGAGTDEAFADNYILYCSTYSDAAYFGDVLKVAKKYDFNNTTGLKKEGTTDATFTVDDTSFVQDSKYANVGRLAIVNTSSSTKTAKISTDASYRKPFANYADADIFAYSIDINLAQFDTWNDNDGPKLNITFDNGGDRYFGAFMFRTGAKGNILRVVKTISGTDITYTDLEFNKSEWYNLKVVIDFKGGKMYFLVNDVVYGSAVLSEIDQTKKFPTKETMTGTASTLFVSLTGDLKDTTDEIFIDNYEMLYGNAPELYTGLTYKCAGNVITNKGEIINNKIDVSFNLLNEGKDVLCVASVTSAESELKSVDAVDVSFKDSEVSKKVNLCLDNLPEDISTGDYTVRIFIWEQGSFIPLTSERIVLEK